MKRIINISLICSLLFIPFLFSSFITKKAYNPTLQGAWKYTKGKETTVIIITETVFSSATYNLEEKKFIASYGGSWYLKNNQLAVKTEWNSIDSSKVGSEWISSYKINQNILTISSIPEKLERLDDGKPGALAGAWIITGSYNNDQVSKRRSPFYPRRTMKILSGKHFQWIAYNVVTKQFIDTGGGTYTTENGKYTETIHFFTKTAESVGKSLSFEYSFVDGDWRHKGQKSTGGPLDECWTKREVLESKQ